ERLRKFRDDLEALVEDIGKSGARPVLVTHAMKATDPPEARHARDLDAMRVFFLRAEPGTMTKMERLAAQAVRELGAAKGIAVLDAARLFEEKTRQRKSGDGTEYFADLTHFTDAGAALMAELLATGLPPLLPERRSEGASP